jgi:hypothetical protein
MAYEATPGELYRGITSVGESFEGETRTVVERDPDFVIFCKQMHHQFRGLGKGAVFSEQHKDAVNFLGWKLSAEEFYAAIKGMFLYGMIIAVIMLAVVYFVGFEFNLFGVKGMGLISSSFGEMANMVFGFIGIVLFGIIGGILFSIYNYPIAVAEDERNKALTYVPEMVGYLIMSMKLVPNLEKAIEFSAKHGKGKVSDDFKKLIWDFQIGVYSSISEGLDMMAYRWGKYSTELKESLMRIRASVMEPSESKRYQILDKTMMEVLESVKEKMGDYARSLNQPSVMLFYIGVLLPLLLVIILPVGSAFSSMPFATAPVLIIIYCFLIPAFAYNFAKGIVKKRPPTYEPPIITDNFTGLPKKWQMKMGGGTIDTRSIAFFILIIGLAVAFVLSYEGLPPKDLMKDSEGNIGFQLLPADKQWNDIVKEEGPTFYDKGALDLYFIRLSDATNLRQGDYYQSLVAQGIDPSTAEKIVLKKKLSITSQPKNDPTKYTFWAIAILTIVGAACFLLYYRNIYKREAQLQIIQMEDEFKESMYMIASRMGENKPVENALKQAKDYLPNLLVSKRIFGKTVENIELMGLPLETAVFDPVYGAMKGIPSKTLSTAMRLLVDSVNLGVEVASRTLMSLSLQMDNMDKVNKALKDLVSDVTTTMQTMAVFIAPMVLGITTALQKVVIMTLSSVVADPSIESATDVGQLAGDLGVSATTNLNSLFKVSIDSFKSFATPLDYLLIVGVYVGCIVFILTYFTTKIQEDNDLVFKINLAKTLPIAMIVYLVTTIVANIAIASVMGGK